MGKRGTWLTPAPPPSPESGAVLLALPGSLQDSGNRGLRLRGFGAAVLGDAGPLSSGMLGCCPRLMELGLGAFVGGLWSFGRGELRHPWGVSAVASAPAMPGGSSPALLRAERPAGPLRKSKPKSSSKLRKFFVEGGGVGGEDN